MPRRSGKVPGYCLHRASGQAVCRINRRDVYLGSFGSPESHQRYERVIAEWRAGQTERCSQQQQRMAAGQRFQFSVSEVIHRYRTFAREYYARDGQPTKEYTEMRYALRPLRQLYGATPAREFGPLALKAVRENMVAASLSRNVVNHRVNRIKRFFKWAVSEELVPSSVYEGLRTVTGLRYGRTDARETEPIKPVPDAWVAAVLPYMSPQVAAMVQLQRLTGMRPCEVVLMRPCDIDMSGEVWLYEPLEHKNRWRGHRRLIPLGPRAQRILQSFLGLQTDAFLFSPRAAEQWRSAERRAQRRTPMTPSQSRRKPKTNPKAPKREQYDVDSYRRAIEYAIRKANKDRDADSQIPHWSPLQLRHSRATEVRKLYGIEGAQVSLGHATADVTQVYAERNESLAREIALKTG